MDGTEGGNSLFHVSDRGIVGESEGQAGQWFFRAADAQGSRLERRRREGAIVGEQVEGLVRTGREFSGHVLPGSPVRLGLLDMETHTEDGIPLPVVDYGGSGIEPGGRHGWCRYLELGDRKEEELDISVRYATGMKKIVVPVNIRFGLSGMEKRQEISTKEN